MDFDIALLERFGGWVVVIWIVSWMRSSMTRMIESSERQTVAMIEEFKEWRKQEAEQHEALEEGNRRILRAIER